MPMHPQVEVEYDGELVKVDEGMVDELRELWQLGARTRYSCQGSSVSAHYIMFIDKSGWLQPEVLAAIPWAKRFRVDGNRIAAYGKEPWK